jgi:hypothetical protein
VLVVAAALATVVLAAPPTASSSRFVQLGIFDDTQILHGATDGVYKQLNSLGVQAIRVNLWWGGPNGFGVAKRKPVNPMNPDDPAYDWGVYDRAVFYASQYRIKVVFSLLGTPPWANAAKGWNVASANALDLKRRARDPGRPQLARVERAEQPDLPEAAVQEDLEGLADPERQGLREDVQRHRRRDPRRHDRRLEGGVRRHRPARQQQPELAPRLRLAARVPARDEDGRR